LELYRANAKKTQDPDLQFEFAVFMVDASKTLPIPELTPGNVIDVEKAIDKREDLIKEATSLLKRNADRGHMPSQYFLADCYANGIGTHKNRQDFDRAFPLFILAAKHGHPDAAYRAGTCCENGWGCRRESAKAIQFYRKAAASSHPGALYRLGLAELNGELGMSRRPKEGVKWLKRSAEHATAEFPHALHELALLHERGIHNVVFVDYEYSAELLAQAAELGYAPSAYRLGECYEYGKMGCPQDPALSIHYYVRPALFYFLFSSAHGPCGTLHCRTSQHSKTTAMRALRSRRGTSSALPVYSHNRTPRRSSGPSAQQMLGSPRPCMRSATSMRSRSELRPIGTSASSTTCFRPAPCVLTKTNKKHRASSMYEQAAALGDTRAADRLNGSVAGRVDTDTIVQRDGGDGAGELPRIKEKDNCVIM
jgi:TPR repeat protein